MAIATSYDSTYTRPSRRESGGRTAPVTISGSGLGPDRGKEHDIKALGSGAAHGLAGFWSSQYDNASIAAQAFVQGEEKILPPEGCNPSDGGVFGNSLNTGEDGHEGDQAMARSDMENDPKYKFGVLDTKVDRLQVDMTNLTKMVTNGFAEVKDMFNDHIANEKRKDESEQTARRDSLWNLRNGLIVAAFSIVCSGIGFLLGRIF